MAFSNNLEAELIETHDRTGRGLAADLHRAEHGFYGKNKETTPTHTPEMRAVSCCKIWGVSDVTWKQSTKKYTQYEGLLNNKKIIIKSYHKKREAVAEEMGLKFFHNHVHVPKLLAADKGVLALEKIEKNSSIKVTADDLGKVLENLYGNEFCYDSSWNYIPSWEEAYGDQLLKILSNYEHKFPHFLKIVKETTSELPKLLKQENRVIHGKITQENIIVSTEKDYYLTNLEPKISPLGWEVAAAIVAQGSKGKDTKALYKSANVLNIQELDSWLKIAGILLLSDLDSGI